MKTYKNPGSTIVEIKPWRREKPGILLVRVKSKIQFFPIRECRCNWKVIFQKEWTYILLPCLRFYRGYCDIEIGLPRWYIQILRTHKKG